MTGIALGRLWSSHPRIAFVVHFVFTLIAVGATIGAVTTGPTWAAVLLCCVLLLMVSSLVFLTWSAAQNGWRPDYEYGYSGRSMLSPRAAWATAQTSERIIWPVFAVTIVAGLVLLTFANLIGFVLVLFSVALGFVGMRAGR